MDLYYFNIIKTCNSNCCFCAANYENIEEKKDIYISADQFRGIATKVNICYNDKIIINGGEPTLNPDLMEILEYSSINGYNTTLFTNGRKLSDINYAKEIINNISKITIPLYGHTSELHNQITRNINSFDETMAALKNLSELYNTHRFIFEIKMLICQTNYKYIVDIAKCILSNFKFSVLLISGLIPSEVALKNNQIVNREVDQEAINSFFDYYSKCKHKNCIILDGIPLCHLTRQNRALYLMNRKIFYKCEKERPKKNYYIDVESIGNMDSNTKPLDIEKWDQPMCYKSECLYKNVCRLNTLINHKDFLKGWIDG